MSKSSLWIASGFVLALLLVVAPFVPPASVLPAGFVALSMALAVWAQIFRRQAASPRKLTVAAVERQGNWVDLTLSAEGQLPAFYPGQFATLALGCAHSEENPVAIAGGDILTRRFVIPKRGGWTGDAAETISIGDEVHLGDPKGRFKPQYAQRRTPQLWVAGEGGIAPFLAALERMKPDAGSPITLVYCVESQVSAPALEEIRRHAEYLPQLDLTIASRGVRSALRFQDFINLVSELPPGTDAYVCAAPGLTELVHKVWYTLSPTGVFYSQNTDTRCTPGVMGIAKASKTLWTSLMARRLMAGQDRNETSRT